MSDFLIPAVEFSMEIEGNLLGEYRFNSNIARHYFCKRCGIYPFHESVRKPGHYRVNLGCLDQVDCNSLSVSLFDGQSL